ncbi:MAG: DNA recombination protein RmuC [Candidatus Omnitrophica bacterium]|nr:DNA recombination protein RmuC [Candidatus Omnitrophota bacterium]
MNAELLLILGTSVVLTAAVAALFFRQGRVPARLRVQLELLEKNLGRIEQTVRDEISRNRHESAANARQDRNEISGMLDAIRGTVRERLEKMETENAAKLDQMRMVVDEKLQSTLERRLGESFKVVSDRLESVHRGLGEMHSLATSVGDLKKVLTNVKTRGTWGEIQLGMLLEQMLTPEQYLTNVSTKKGTADRVEFAIKLPGGEDNRQPVFLPIDAKFPQEDYQRLCQAQESGDAESVERWTKQLETRIKTEAKNIRQKYIDPPHTTDFAILYLPTEGLFAEVLRRPGLFDTLRREFQVVAAGPTTLTAVLNSLQMGFRTLAIQKRSSEVWQLLASVKTEFAKFGDILEKTRKKLSEASNTIDAASRKSRTIERRLRNVQSLPSAEYHQSEILPFTHEAENQSYPPGEKRTS